ncbi:MAG: methyltransferase [Selenomonadaceae bacterium]|nr:methyltransferase [Selenomonadaceae bacterium]MBQ6131895.1 methyltransferase [Selenomonadaceae bacterium]
MINNFERREILNFVPPNFLPVPVLVIESAELLKGLREILPAAQIAFMTAELSPAIKNLCDKCRADLVDELPIAPKVFELIIDRQVLTTGENFYSTLRKFNYLLKDSGFLLTQFYNVRFAGILERLRRGKFFNNEQRLWAKADVVKLLDDALYKEIRFMPGERGNFSATEWESFGFDNFNDDLTTKIWLVKACKCTAEVAALKEIFTPEVRADLSRLLHRIEYDIDAEENFRRLMELCDRTGIFDDYLSDFINQVVVHAEAKNFIKARTETFGRILDLDS